MVLQQVKQKTVSAANIDNLDVVVNAFISQLENDPAYSYVVTPMPCIFTGNTFVQNIIYVIVSGSFSQL